LTQPAPRRQCYESRQLERTDAALRCYRRALANEDAEGIALARLAKLHERLGQLDEAASFYERNLARMDAEGVAGAELSDTLQFLARRAKAAGEWDKATELFNRLLDFGGPLKETAKASLREIELHGAAAGDVMADE
jgi:anaphase-promoting complex subunit 8